MGIDSGLAKAFGYLVVGVIAIATTTTAIINLFSGNQEVFDTAMSVIVVYSGILAITAIGIALYVFIRREDSV